MKTGMKAGTKTARRVVKAAATKTGKKAAKSVTSAAKSTRRSN